MINGRILGGTRTAGGRAGKGEVDYLPIHVRDVLLEDGKECMITLWEPTPRELVNLLLGGKVVISMLGSNMSPMLVEAERVREGEGEEDELGLRAPDAAMAEYGEADKKGEYVVRVRGTRPLCATFMDLFSTSDFHRVQLIVPFLARNSAVHGVEVVNRKGDKLIEWSASTPKAPR
jgi:hypothetical protein